MDGADDGKVPRVLRPRGGETHRGQRNSRRQEEREGRRSPEKSDVHGGISRVRESVDAVSSAFILMVQASSSSAGMTREERRSFQVGGFHV
jgi:hypothetical protein